MNKDNQEPQTAEQIWNKHFEGWTIAGQIKTNAFPAMEEYARLKLDEAKGRGGTPNAIEEYLSQTSTQVTDHVPAVGNMVKSAITNAGSYMDGSVEPDTKENTGKVTFDDMPEKYSMTHKTDFENEAIITFTKDRHYTRQEIREAHIRARQMSTIHSQEGLKEMVEWIKSRFHNYEKTEVYQKANSLLLKQK